MSIAQKAFNLSQKLGWPHTLAEWRLMARQGRPLTLDDGATVYATALLTACDKMASVGMVLVTPDCRKKFAATALTNIIVKQAQEIGLDTIVLFSSHQAHNLYKRAGFEDIGSLEVLVNDAHGHAVIEDERDMPQLPTRGVAAKIVSQKYYDGDSKRRGILKSYLKFGERFFVEIQNEMISGFAGTIKRVSATGDVSLAVGPFIADNADIADRLAQRLSVCQHPTRFFILNTISHHEAANYIRNAAVEALLRKGYNKVDSLPVMSLNGRPIPLYEKPEILSPITLAFG